MWTGSYSVKKDGEDIKLGVIAASVEKTAEAAPLKAHQRGHLMTDAWLTQAERLRSDGEAFHQSPLIAVIAFNKPSRSFEMSDAEMPLIKIAYVGDYTIHAWSEEKAGDSFPLYQIFKGGKPVTSTRTSLLEPFQNSALAINAGIERAADDIRLGLLEFPS